METPPAAEDFQPQAARDIKGCLFLRFRLLNAISATISRLSPLFYGFAGLCHFEMRAYSASAYSQREWSSSPVPPLTPSPPTTLPFLIMGTPPPIIISFSSL